MAWRLAGDQHADRTGTSIPSLMPLAGQDFEPFTGVKNEIIMFHFKRQFAFENKEELAGMTV